LPAHYIFHYLNAWEETYNGDEIIKIYALKYDIMNIRTLFEE
jgi:carotenoid cleavage dioxygenase-like enzyme